ncbi:class I SAM-dependent methyltransferase [Streptomyces sp. NBC_01498]|uniref:class I SAM-dependent methyltransferase n=1 Tax=Streptomyces sp. NBC_01498 TaxID=2975870 RepID=UPI002E7B0047|nr:class I SAM-dependent methyltransferase [Streptomyces sp. NBC_01498]WTL25001.1 class I SAM-dependent methyltransferase [Streptomyces sp. NBC_01498]
MPLIAGTAGYGAAAEDLARQYESVSFQEVHGETLPFFPPPPGRAVDLGAGSGRDAAALAGLGYDVVAVEPTAELREIGRRTHADAHVHWIDSALPGVEGVRGPFDLVLSVGVWMHLDQRERRTAMERVRSLLAPGGRVVITLRHGPIPVGRRMFDVSLSEVVVLGRRTGLLPLLAREQPDRLGRAGVSWSVVVLEAPRT